MYQDAAEEYRWRITAENGEIIAAATEGYKDKTDCIGNLNLVKGAILDAIKIQLEFSVSERKLDFRTTAINPPLTGE
jgi:uncharacterized protein YegP (UPF0339 family)